jgi:hypothetical protein
MSQWLGTQSRHTLHLHTFAVLTASCCASSTFDLGVHRAWRKRNLRNHYRNIPARGGNQVFGQRHKRPFGGSAATSSTRLLTHCARTVSNFLICGLFICVSRTCTTGCYICIFIFVLCQWRFNFDCLWLQFYCNQIGSFRLLDKGGSFCLNQLGSYQSDW